MGLWFTGCHARWLDIPGNAISGGSAMLKGTLEASPQRRLLSFNSSAEYCGVTQQTIRRLMARGVLTPVRFPEVRRILFDKRVLDRLIEAGKASDKGTEDALPLAAVGADGHGQG